MSTIILGYWNIRSRAQQLRFLLEYVEAKYTQKFYEFTPENKAEWFEKDKKVLKPFPNLPYIIDGDLFLTEHDAIIKYILKKYPKYLSLLGINQREYDDIRIEQLVNVVNDIRLVLRNLYFDKNYKDNAHQVFESILPKINQLIEFKGDNQFLLPYLTIVDFKFVEVLLLIKAIAKEEYNQNLISFDPYIQRFYSLPKISDYVKTPQYHQFEDFFPPAYSAFTGKEFIKEFNQQFLVKQD